MTMNLFTIMSVVFLLLGVVGVLMKADIAAIFGLLICANIYIVGIGILKVITQ